MIESGEVLGRDLRADAVAYQVYAGDTVTKAYALEAYRKLCATHFLRDAAQNETAFVYARFAQDAVDEHLTAAELDWAIEKWRKGEIAFAPTIGQILALVRPSEGYSGAPLRIGVGSYEARVNAAMSPPAQPNDTRAHEPPKNYRSGMTYEEFESLPEIEKFNAYSDQLAVWDKQKESGLIPVGLMGETRPWQLSDDECYASLLRKVEFVRTKVEAEQ